MYRGALRLPSQDCKTVAIKTLKDTSPDGYWWNFLREATIMGQFNHPHILRLEGVITKSMYSGLPPPPRTGVECVGGAGALGKGNRLPMEEAPGQGVMHVLCLRKAHHDRHRIYGKRSPGCLSEGETGRGPAQEGSRHRASCLAGDLIL